MIEKLEFIIALSRERHFGNAAEACGAYPVESAPESIVVGDGIVDGRDFLVAYRITVPTSSSSKSASNGVRPVTRQRRIIH